MAATATVGSAESERDAAAATRSPWVPCLAAWLIPGAGHLLLGRTVPGLVFTAVILSSFVIGASLDGTVYAFDAEQPLSYLATVANLGAGPVDAWARVQTFGTLRYVMPDSRVDPVLRERVLRVVRQRFASRSHAYGRTFLLTAGLMNLLLVLDVYDYCIGRKQLRGEAAGGGGGPGTAGDAGAT